MSWSLNALSTFSKKTPSVLQCLLLQMDNKTHCALQILPQGVLHVAGVAPNCRTAWGLQIFPTWLRAR